MPPHVQEAARPPIGAKPYPDRHDMALVVVNGRLASRPELFDDPRSTVRMLVLVRSVGPPRRIDVLPVDWHRPDPAATTWAAGTRVWIVGALRRTFEGSGDTRHSRLIIEALSVDPSATLGDSEPGR